MALLPASICGTALAALPAAIAVPAIGRRPKRFEFSPRDETDHRIGGTFMYSKRL
jgi:hypothetical protein